MSAAIDRILDAVSNVLGGLHVISERRPDAKIGNAAGVFNRLLETAKRELPTESAIQALPQLGDQDTFVTYVSCLRELEAHLVSIANEIHRSSRSRAIQPRPPYGD